MSFTSGTSDGLADIDEGQSSQSTGVIPSKDANGNPKEIWEANGQFNPSFNVTTGSFLVEREGIPINVGGSSAQLLRRLRLVAFDSLEGQTVQKNVIVGEFLEEVRHKDDPSITYLDITRNGTFSLFRDISESASIESPLDPTN